MNTGSTSSKSCVAFLAIRMARGPKTTEPQAIVVGTMPAGVPPWKEGDWRYVTYPLGVLLKMLDNNEDPLVPGTIGQGSATWATVDDVLEVDRFDDKEREDVDSVFEKSGLFKQYLDESITIVTPGGPKSIKRVYTAFPLRSVERAYFYTFAAGEVSTKLKEPFAALDAARVVHREAIDTYPIPFKAITPEKGDGSRIILVPDFSDPHRSGLLAAMAIRLEMKSVVNGHFQPTTPERSATDPRILLDAGVVSRGSSLWMTSEGKPDPARGLNFGIIRLRCTLGPGTTNWGIKLDKGERDLFGLAAQHCAIQFRDADKVWDCGHLPQDSKPYYLLVMPAVDNLRLPVISERHADRQFGFRVFEDGQQRKVGWRFESALVRYGLEFAEWAVDRGLIPERIVANHGLAERLPSEVKATFVEEQRLDEITFDPWKRAAQTALTVKFVVKFGQEQLDELLTEHVLGIADSGIAKIQGGLKRVRDGRPISLMPRLQPKADQFLSWNAAGFLTDATPGWRLDPYIRDEARSGALVAFEPATTKDDFWKSKPGVQELPAVATFAHLLTEERIPPKYRATIGVPAPSRAFQSPASDYSSKALLGTRFRVTLTERVATTGERLRKVLIGALEFTLGDKFPAAEQLKKHGQIDLIGLKPDSQGNPEQLDTAIRCLTVMPIQTVDPGVQDESDRDVIVNARQRQERDFRVSLPDRFAPLLVPLKSAASPATSAAIKLSAEEVATRDRDHTIALSLRVIEERAPGPTAPVEIGRVLVIDPRPFRIAAVEYQAIGGAATSESNEVAVWNAEAEGGLSWRVRDDGQSVGLELPPQVLGEAMEKNLSTDPNLPKDIQPGLPSAMRFGSSTRLRIDPTFADTRLREPGWNLRRILGNALQRLPGARLLELRFEFLYGLLTRVRSDGLLLTELAGAVGEPALPLSDTDTDPIPKDLQPYKKLVDDVLEVERFRIAVDKIYRTRPDEYLRIEDGTSFKLRLRQFDANGALKGGPKTPLRWPVPGAIPEDTGDLIRPEVLQQTFSTADADTDSFPGGLSWAFESANILMSVYGRPQSDGGNVGGIYLGAHGGYGSQRALFDLRKSIVETETTQGRVHRYRLERVGRIACLWHPAKHVIVYERTVVPSGQFYNTAPINIHQDEHAGRAIPRKVEEYVEILKPTRHYPEDGSSIRAAGCLVGAEFKSIKIRVDSKWGSDVRREGWQVPLWNTEFDKLPGDPNNPDDPASIYPKPQIRLTFAGREKDVMLEVDEPAKLVFYTSVIRDEDDRTDLWKPVRDVDFGDVPKVSAGQVQTQSADLSDAILPPEPEHVPGYERFTIGLVPSKDMVALAHGRAADGPLATLRNVTIARSVALSTDQNVPDLGRGMGAKVANVRAALDSQVGRVVATLEKVDRDLDPKEWLRQANNQITEACRNVTLVIDKIDGVEKGKRFLDGIPKDCRGVTSRARASLDGQLTRFLAAANALLDTGARSILERIDAVGGVIEGEVSVVDGIAAHVEQAVGELQTVPAEEVERILSALRASAQSAQARIDKLGTSGYASIKSRIDQAKHALDHLTDLTKELDELRKKTVVNLEAVRALVGENAHVDPLLTAVDGVRDDVGRCYTELKAHAGTITADARAAASLAKAKIGDARTKMENLERQIPDGMRRFLERLEGGLARVESLVRWVEKAADTEYADVLALAAKVNDVAVNAAKDLRAAKDQLLAIGGTLLKDLQTELEALLGSAISEVKKVIDAVEQSQKKALVDALDEVDHACQAALDAVVKAATAQLDALAHVPSPPKDYLTVLKAIATELRGAAGTMRSTLKAAGIAARNAHQAVTQVVEERKRALTTALDGAAAKIRTMAETLIKEIENQCERLTKEFERLATNAYEYVNDRLKEVIDVEYLRGELERDLKAAMGPTLDSIAAVKARVAAKAAEIARAADARARRVLATLQQKVQTVAGSDLAEAARRAEGVYQKGDNALRLIRAVGDPPKTDSLGFNRPEVAYVFGEAKELGIDITPTLALVNRVADQVAAVEQAGKAVGELLDSFGVRLPVTQVASQLIPDKLRNLSVSDLLPDMGGIDLRGLLQNVGFPDLDDSDAVKVRHGFDKAARRAWMEADLDVPFAKSVPLLSFGPVQILIDTAQFSSRARLSAGAGGGVERKMSGRIFGDWRVVCSGQTILTFRQSALQFTDSGQIDFHIQPERVELAEALRFITDLLRATGQKGGVRIEPFMRGGVPAGVAATLDMVLPSIQSGAFGISDLSLHILFGIAAIPRFEITSELAVGSRLTPFSLNVWILTGGGYVTQRLTYVPMAKPKPLLTYTLDIAVLAGLGIGFSFGVVSGGVWLQVGCGIALTWTTGAGGNSTTVRVFLLARGNVDVAGIITASISLLFEIAYDGERMIGAGTLSISVKISVFFTLNVDQHVEYVFAGQKKKQLSSPSSPPDPYC